MLLCVRACFCVYVHACLSVCVYRRVFVCMYVPVFVCIYLRVFVCLHLHVYVHVHACVFPTFYFNCSNIYIRPTKHLHKTYKNNMIAKQEKGPYVICG